MAERPIIFSAELVTAILDGRKTETRRPVTLKTVHGKKSEWDCYDFSEAENGGCELLLPCKWTSTSQTIKRLRPRVEAGDVLWVRETWAEPAALTIAYRADDVTRIRYADGRVEWGKLVHLPGSCKWRAPMYMSHWASRITLSVTGVRFQRIRDLNGEDAWQEGADGLAEFQQLWNSIYGKKAPWDANPWVVVYEFERCEKEVAGG